ncbi:MAG: energy transducer TonB [Polyangia bacterium]
MPSQAGGKRPRPALVEVVLGLPRPERRWYPVAALLLTIGLHASLLVWSRLTQRSLESWSAALAARVHADLSREEFVDLAKPPPPEEKPKTEPSPQLPPLKMHVAARHAEPAKFQPPAQAGAIVARADSAPVDLTSTTFVTGSAGFYAGGATAANGTSRTAVHERDVVAASPPLASQPDRSRAVALADESWSCPWPREADAEHIDEQTVVIRALVREDGSVESATIVADPGHGFGAAAVACALRTEFEPARNRAGQPIRAKSPPIRVRFVR